MVAGGLHLFTLEHLQHLDLIISWQVFLSLFPPPSSAPLQGIDWKIQTLCTIASLFAALSIIIPILLRRPRTKETGSLGYVPGEAQGMPLLQSLSSNIASYLLIGFCGGTAAFEMMIRDQV